VDCDQNPQKTPPHRQQNQTSLFNDDHSSKANTGFPVPTHEAERNARELQKRKGLFAVVTNAATLHNWWMLNDPPFCAYSV